MEEGQIVKVAAEGAYEGVDAEYVAEGEDADGNAVVFVKIHDERSGQIVHASFPPDQIEEATDEEGS